MAYRALKQWDGLLAEVQVDEVIMGQILAAAAGQMDRTMFLAKGSLFLGRMTQLSDGISILLERNG